MKPEDSVVSKVKKLLALASGNQNDNEREVAMKFAMDLLAKHNLTLEQLEGPERSGNVQQLEENSFRLEPWVRQVLNAVCMIYYTDYFICTKVVSVRQDMWTFQTRTSTKDVPVFVGTAENIAVTIEVGTWLMNSIRSESNRVYKDATLKRSFRLGAARTLYARAQDMLNSEKAPEENSSGTSLMVLRDKLVRANDEYLDSLNLRQVNYRNSRVNMTAYNAGQTYGQQIAMPSRTSSKSISLSG